MPIDTSIYANLRPVAPIQPLNPMDLLAGAAKIQDIQAQVEQRRLAGEKARQDAQDQAQIRSVFAANPDDVDAAIKQLYAVNPRVAAPLEEQIGKARKEKLDAASLGLKNQGMQADQALMLARTVDVDTGKGYALARPAIVATSPVLDPILPAVDAQWDPARWSQILQAGVSGKELLDAKQKALEFWGKGDVRNSLATMYSHVDPTSPTAPQAWAQIGRTARDMGAKQSEIDVFGPYDGPGAPARAAKLGITPKDQAELDAKAAAERQTAAHQTVEEQQAAANAVTARGQLGVAQARERREAGTPELVQVLQDGKPVWLPKAQAVGLPAAGGAAARPATVPEHKALAFYNRAQEAVATLTAPDATTGQTLEDSVGGLGLAAGKVPVIGNYLMSDAAQRYTEAQRAFTEARLRSEAGARVPESAYLNDQKTYFKQPGDTPAVIEQKRKARETVLNGLAGEAGKAYDEYYGAPYTRTTGTTPGASSPLAPAKVGERRLFNGKWGEWDGQGWKPVP